MDYYHVSENASDCSDISPEESMCNQELLIPQLRTRKNNLKDREYHKMKAFNCPNPKMEVEERSINVGVRQTNVANHPTIVEHKIKVVKDKRFRMSLPSVERHTKNVETFYYGSNKESGDTLKGELADFLTYPVNVENIKIPRKRELHAVMHHRLCNNVNPDIIVIIDNHEFLCHRMVLQCYSKYFDEINNISDENIFTIDEKGVTKQAFTAVYAWMLSLNESGLKYITRENFVEVLLASQVLQIRDLEEQCLALMDSTEVFSEGHAYQLFKQASRFGQHSIKESMVPRIQHFFLPFVSTQDFIDLPIEDLCTFLSSSYIVVHSEMEVFMSAARWLLEDWNARKQHLPQVMNCVRFGLMNPLELVDIRKNPGSPEFLKITENTAIQKYIDDGLAYATYCTMKGGSDDLKYRCQLFGLEIPQPRNWSDTTKYYKSYNEFLSYLKQIRVNPLKVIDDNLQKVQSSPQNYQVAREENTFDIDLNSPLHAFSDGIPSMSNLLTVGLKNKEKIGKHKDINKGNYKLEAFKPNLMLEGNRPQSPSVKKRPESLRTKAAIIIQAAFRGYRVRKQLNFSNQLKYNNAMVLDYKELAKSAGYNSIAKEKSSHSQFKKSSSDITVAGASKASHPGPIFLPSSSAILLLGGLNPQQELSQSNNGRAIYRYSSDLNQWEKVGYLPKGRYYHNAAFLRGKVFILGGVDPKREDQRQQSICSEVWSFNPANSEWYRETNMNTPRKNFGVVSFQDHIYALGGQGPNDVILCSVEKYDPIRKVWEEVCPLPEPKLSPAVTVFGGTIWVAGGMGTSVKPGMAVQVYCYDFRQNKWIPKPPLRSGRGFSVLVGHEEKLYLVGGAEKDRERGSSLSSSTVDVFDPKQNKWEVCAKMRTPRHSHSSVVLDNCLYVMGGTTTQHMKSLSDMEIWCLGTKTWMHHTPLMPMVLTGHASVVLPPGSQAMK